MRIVIDMQGAQSHSSGQRGVGRYTRALCKALLQRARGHEIILVFNSALAISSPKEMDALRDELFIEGLPYKAHYWQQIYDCSAINPINQARGLAAKLTREAFLTQLMPDVILSTNLQEGLFDSAPTSVKLLDTSTGFCSTLHDLTPLRLSELYLADPNIRDWYEEKIRFAKDSDLIITDSEYSKRDIVERLGVPKEKVGVVPLAFDSQRFKPLALSSAQAEVFLTRYGIPAGFILYTGGSDIHKNLPNLFAAYANLPNSLREKHKLIMIGKHLQESFAATQGRIQGIDISSDVIFPGYVSDEDLAHFYALCHLFVFPSLYEGFGLPVLEALACGAPVITSNTSSLPEVVGLESAMFDPNNVQAMCKKIEQALTDRAFREELKAHSVRQAAHFSWEQSAETLLDLLELHFSDRQARKNPDPIKHVIEALATNPLAYSLESEDISAIALSLEQSFPPSTRGKRLYIDVSAQIQTSDHTGIQRVTRALAQELRQHPPFDYETVLIYTQPNESNFKVAGTLIDLYDGHASYTTLHTPVQFYDSDILLFLDLHPRVTIEWEDRIQYLRNRGIKVYHVVYDLIPYTHPQFFWPALCEDFNNWLNSIAKSDGVFCISNAVAETMRDWLKQHTSHRPSFHVGWFHLGADLENSMPSRSLPTNAEELLAKMRGRTMFLMVGTLEPRKGHEQTLSAFELLWGENRDVHLVIIGKQGWGVDNLAEVIQQHPEFNERLFWLPQASDALLERIYEQADALIAASYAEGFGLPLIEAARHHLPIIARDIPVFREVAGEHAYYYVGTGPGTLAQDILTWLDLNAKGEAPVSGNMKWLTWEESAEQLMHALFTNIKL